MSKVDLHILSVKDLKKISKLSGIVSSNKNKEEIIKDLSKKFKQIDSERYKRIKKIGSGGKDGTVYLVEFKKGKNIEKYALKQFRMDKSPDLIQKEAKFLELCGKEGISPKIIEVDINSRFIVMDLMGESLFNVLKATDGIMSIYQQKEFVKIISKLDEIGIYHGDPSPLNFLFDPNYKLKIIDFGFGEKIDKDFIKKHGTNTPNKKFMLLGFLIKMKSLGIDINRNYNYIKSQVDIEDLKKCGILLNEKGNGSDNESSGDKTEKKSSGR